MKSLKLVRLVITGEVPQRLEQYSRTLDVTDPLMPPRATVEPGIKVKEGLRNVSIRDFVAQLRGWGRLVSAWREIKEVPQKKGPPKRYRNSVYIWAAQEDAVMDVHFRPVCRAIEEEFYSSFSDKLFDLRVLWDNQHCNHETGEPIQGARRWEVLLNNPRPMNGSRDVEELGFFEYHD